MGHSVSVFLGPYVLVETKKVRTTLDKLVCEKCRQIPNSDKAKFCSACGLPLTLKQEFTFKPPVDPHTLTENEALFFREEDSFMLGSEEYKILFMPNRRMENVHHSYTYEMHGRREMLILREDPHSDLDVMLFQRQFAPEIESIRLAYGSHCVKVRWGLLRLVW